MFVERLFAGLFNKPVRKRQDRFWKRFNRIPKSLTRICMFIVYHGNKVNRRWLISELVDNNCVKNSNTCNVILHRAIESKILVEDAHENISVVEPMFFVLKEVKGNVFDDWKILVVPSLILTMVFVFFSPFMAVVLGFVSLLLVLGWLREDSKNTYHY